MKKLILGRKYYSATDAPFKVPSDLVSQTAAVLARKGAGKTYTASVMAEELLGAHSQVVVIDPLNAWWGLRSSKTGKRAGFPIVIFGGRQGDMALTEEMARPIADAVAENPGLSCVLSLRHMRKNAMRRFVTDFAEQLFHRKGETRYATPLHLYIDEADMFAPQRVFKGGERMLGAMEDIVRRGRQAGIGITMITQRPQSLNKDVLTQIELLVVGQITGPHDRKAIKEWIEQNADVDRLGGMLLSLAELQVGELWFWSPSWLRAFERVRVRKRNTFDSSATPKYGTTVREPKRRHKVNLDQIKQQIGDAAQKAEASDPKKLQREIADLKKKLAAAGNGSKKAPPVVAVQGYDDSQVTEIVARHLDKRDKEWAVLLSQQTDRMYKASAEEMTRIVTAPMPAPGVAAIRFNKKTTKMPPSKKPADIEASIARAKVGPIRTDPPAGPSDSDLTKIERGILSVLVQRDSACHKKLVAIQAGYSITSGSFGGALASLRKKGYIVGPGGSLSSTPEGADAIGHVDPLPTTGDELVQFWLGKLKSSMERALLQEIAGNPAGISKEDLCARTNYSYTSGSVGGALANLRSLKLIEGPSSNMRLSDELR